MQLFDGHVKRSGKTAFRAVKHSLRKNALKGLFGVSLIAAATQMAYGAAELKTGDATLTLGIGLRTSYTSTENGAPSGTNYSNGFGVENSRIYMSGSYGSMLKATMNFDRTGGATGGAGLRMIDGIAQIEPTEGFKLWMGRFLPPSDRANLYGPFFTSAWSYPGVASAGPAIAAGRDDGAMVFGKPFGPQFLYAVGAFNGHNRAAGLSNQGNKLLYAGRLQYSFWDPEGYYLNGSYLGDKDVLTLGGSLQSQTNGVGSAAAPGDLKIWNIDLLAEKKLAGGLVPTFEGAYYRYDLDKVDCGSGEPGAPGCLGAPGNVGGLVAGKAYLGTIALLFPEKIGWGNLQPFIRYQKFNRDVSSTTNKATDFGLNYLIKGTSAKLSAVYTKFDDSRLVGKQDFKQFVLGMQLQY